MTSESAVRLALDNNRTLRAARLALSAAEARSRGAGRLSNPELGLEVAGGQDFEGRIEIGLTQKFPLTARLRLEKEISRLEIEAAKTEIAEQEWSIASEVREAFVRLVSATENRVLLEKQTQVSKSFAESMGRRVTEGFSSSLEADQAKVEALELQAGIEGARADEAAARANLAILLGGRNEGTVKDALALPTSLPQNKEAASRPDVRLAEIAIEAAEKDIGLARAMRWEDIGLGVFVEGERNRDEPEGIDTEGLIGMRLSIPLPVWNSGQAAVEEKRAIFSRRQEMLEAIRLTASQQETSTWQQMKTRFTAAQQMQNDVLPLARKVLNDTQSAYERGEVDVQSVFRLRQRLIEIETATLEAIQQFHQTRAQWLRARGVINP